MVHWHDYKLVPLPNVFMARPCGFYSVIFLIYLLQGVDIDLLGYIHQCQYLGGLGAS